MVQPVDAIVVVKRVLPQILKQGWLFHFNSVVSEPFVWFHRSDYAEHPELAQIIAFETYSEARNATLVQHNYLYVVRPQSEHGDYLMERGIAEPLGKQAYDALNNGFWWSTVHHKPIIKEAVIDHLAYVRDFAASHPVDWRWDFIDATTSPELHNVRVELFEARVAGYMRCLGRITTSLFQGDKRDKTLKFFEHIDRLDDRWTTIKNEALLTKLRVDEGS